jgi:flagellar motor protein MotB
MLALELETKSMKEAAQEAEKLAKAREKAEQKKAKEDVAAGAAATSLFNQLLTETEQIQVEFEKRQQIIDDAVTAGQYTTEQAEALRTMIVADAAKQRTKIVEDEATEQAKLRKDAIKGIGDQLMTLDSSNKKVFQMQKAYRMAEATMAAYQGATNALAAPFPFPIPQVMAGAALTLGLANVAQIKAQSFEGGGFTGYGARAGGLDGKGGRMAMIHPNETVVDHRNGGAAGVTIVNNVDARGAGADVDQKIKMAMAQTSQQTVLQVQDLIRRKRLV